MSVSVTAVSRAVFGLFLAGAIHAGAGQGPGLPTGSEPEAPAR